MNVPNQVSSGDMTQEEMNRHPLRLDAARGGGRCEG
jgi:hypothetical protein